MAFPSPSEQSDEILKRLLTLHPKVIDLSLGRTLALLEKLGRPQDRLPPVVHVAGTNGKGSTIAFLRAILEAAGYSVHVYTSPHLTRFAERIRLAGEIISEEALTTLLADVETINEGEPITYFEITTCAAFKAFAETNADVLLLETGLGGRLDSTNVVDTPVCTAITPISLDHMQFLGPDIASIATEKAAIQKPGCASVIAPQQPDAETVIKRYGEEVGAKTIDAIPVDEQTKLGLPGAHQRINAGTAHSVAAVLRGKGFEISDTHIAKGLESATWPARMQQLTQGTLVDLLPKGWSLWLDGGHNEAAAGAIADMARDKWTEDAPLYLVFGMLTSKTAEAFIATLSPVVTKAATVAIPGEENSYDAGTLAELGKNAGLDVMPYETVTSAVTALLDRDATPKSGHLLICGSLYLAGSILKNHS